MPEAGASVPKILLVIPVYNHASTLRAVASQALGEHPEVLVVDDGSTDGAVEALEGLPLRLIRHETNRGKGAAIMTAVAEARRIGASHIVTIDADGQHEAADFVHFSKSVEEDPRAIVVGKRDFESGAIPGSATFGRGMSNFWFRVETGIPLGDTQSGYRAYPVAVLEILTLKETRYSFEQEVLVRAAWAGVPLREVDIRVHYPPGKERITHYRRLVDNLRAILINAKLVGRSIVPWPHQKITTCAAGVATVSVLHPLRSLRALLTENASPKQLAAAAATGIVFGTIPIIPFQTLAILFAAAYLRLNKVAAVAVSQICCPPFVPALCILVGYYFRHGELMTEFSWKTLGYQGLERLWEWLLGSVVVAPLLALTVSGLTYLLALAVKRKYHIVGG